MKVLKMQNGGNIITAPNPQPYRAPLRGINPNVFKYNINSTPVDTSGMVQILQFNENADLKRQQQAIQLEQAKIKKEIEEAKLKFQKDKFAYQILKDVNQLSKSAGGGVLSTTGEPFNNNLENTAYIKAHFQEPLSRIDVYKTELDKLSTDPLSPDNSRKMLELSKKIAEERSKMGSDFSLGVEYKIGDTLEKILSGDPKLIGKDMEVNPFILDNTVKERDFFYNNYKSNWWEFGSPSNIPSNILFNRKEEGDKYETLLTGLLSSYTTDDVDPIKVGQVGNALIKTKKETIALDLNTVVKNVSDAIYNDKKLASWFSNQVGANIFTSNNDINKELLGNLVEENVKSRYQAAVAGTKGNEIDIRVTSADPVNRTSKVQYENLTPESDSKTVTINQEITKKGGFNDIKTESGNSDKEVAKAFDNLTPMKKDKLIELREALVEEDIDPDGQVAQAKIVELVKSGNNFDVDDVIEDIKEMGRKEAGKELGDRILKTTNESLKRGAEVEKSSTPKNPTPSDLLKRGNTTIKTSGKKW